MKMTIVQNQDRLYSLANRNNAIRNYCSEDDIIIDIDADDELIGNYIFQLYNSLYQTNPDKWLIYSNTLNYDEMLRQPIRGKSSPIDASSFENNALRVSSFNISELRSFPRKVFMKIDEQEFLDS